MLQSASFRCTRSILASLLTLPLAACTGSSPTGTPSPLPASAAGHRAKSVSVPRPTSTDPTVEQALGPPPASTQMIQGYFSSPTSRTALRLSRGPDDVAGFERLTRLAVEAEGVPEYSMAGSAVRLAGVCRTSGSELDQILLAFHTEHRGGERLGVLWYDPNRGRFALSFTPRDIRQDGGLRLDCSGDRVPLPEAGPALPCTCPWRDEPDHPSQAPGKAVTSDTREILILPEEPGGMP
jgi:hypothetical protein